jgi:hypothetical protein
MTAGIGERVAWFRKRAAAAGGKKMTVQALADRCADLGLPLGRVTIAKLERGMRQTITPAEVMVLAAALGVPPIELLLPVGYQETAEILPGQQLPALDAARWFAGERQLVNFAGDIDRAAFAIVPEPGEESAVGLLELHADQLRSWDRAVGLDRLRRQGGDADVNREWMEEISDQVEQSLRVIRAQMRRRDMLLPEVPPELDIGEPPLEEPGDGAR